jgi:hypothetical protein
MVDSNPCSWHDRYRKYFKMAVIVGFAQTTCKRSQDNIDVNRDSANGFTKTQTS